MLTCPMCKKSLARLDEQCPTCRTDLSLLVDYVSGLEGGLARAEAHTREGRLGEAVWAYLEVLEVDPDNPTARRQVGQVAAAVRQFDRAAPGRRWLDRLRRRARFRRWAESWADDANGRGWGGAVLLFLLVLGALVIGYVAGYQHGREPPAAEQPAVKAPP